MHRLVCSGYARPGQSSWALLDGFDLELLLDVVYGELVAGAGPEHKTEIDKRLDEAHQTMAGPSEEELVEVRRKSDGKVIQISEARLAQLRRNAAGSTHRPRPGQHL